MTSYVLMFRCPACPNRIIVHSQPIGSIESNHKGHLVLCARCHTAIDFTEQPKVARINLHERRQLAALTTRELQRRNAHAN